MGGRATLRALGVPFPPSWTSPLECGPLHEAARMRYTGGSKKKPHHLLVVLVGGGKTSLGAGAAEFSVLAERQASQQAFCWLFF